MRLYFSSLYSLSYLKALLIVRKEQPKMWKFFSEQISIFSAVSNCCLASVWAQWIYRNSIRESKKLYEAVWKKEKIFVESKLSELFGIQFKNKKIVAHICVTPLYIRNIKKGLFLLPVGADSKRLMNIIVHELSHFYCYQGYETYHYKGDDMWEISEYLVPYLLEKYFYEICETETESYFGVVPENYERCIKKWLDMEWNFEEFLSNIPLINHL